MVLVLKDYFKSRKQRVVSNGMVSNWGSINCGVPQGSILGLLLFNIYVNDLLNAVTESCLHLFADDTTLSILHLLMLMSTVF